MTSTQRPRSWGSRTSWRPDPPDHGGRHVEPRRFATDGAGKVVVDVHQVVRDRSGTVMVDQMVQHVYVIQDGSMRHMEIRTRDRE